MHVEMLLFQWDFYQIELQINPELCLDLNHLTDAKCQRNFQFNHNLLRLVVSQLHLPDVINIQCQKDHLMAVGGFCLVLQGLSYPNHWFDLKKQFCHHASAFGQFFYYMEHLILQHIKISLISFPLTRQRSEEYADAFQFRIVTEFFQLTIQRSSFFAKKFTIEGKTICLREWIDF